MTLTEELLRTWFQQFNAEYFGNKLPEPRLIVSSTRIRLGCFSWHSEPKYFYGLDVLSGFTIRVSNYYDMQERQYQETLLHEMIHFYIAYQHLKDNGTHGRLFREYMNRINRQGWHITVSLPRNQLPLSARYRNLQYLVLSFVDRFQNHYLTVVNPSYKNFLERKLARNHDFIMHRWFISTDAYFSSFPRVRTLRVRKVSKEEFFRYVDAAKEWV